MLLTCFEIRNLSVLKFASFLSYKVKTNQVYVYLILLLILSLTYISLRRGWPSG